MRRGRIGHVIFAAIWLLLAAEAVDRALRIHRVFLQALNWTFALVLFFVIVVPAVRTGFAKTKPISVWESFAVFGVDWSKRAKEFVREFIEPGEEIAIAAMATIGTGLGARLRWIGLTEGRVVALKPSSFTGPPIAIDFSEPRASMHVISQGPNGSYWEILMARGAEPRQRYRFSRRYAKQAQAIAEELSAPLAI